MSSADHIMPNINASGQQFALRMDPQGFPQVVTKGFPQVATLHPALNPAFPDYISEVNTVHDNSSPEVMIEWAASVGPVAMSSSFGMQASVLLHLASQIIPGLPVIMVDTGYLPRETYLYAEELKELLNLNLVVVSNTQWSPARMEAIYGRLWEQDEADAHKLYGQMRKAEPLATALDGLEPGPQLLLSGVRSSQTKARANMKRVSRQRDGRLKVLPILRMSDSEVENYMQDHNLPRHPLTAAGYVTVGDWHSSRPLKEGEDPRGTRFGGKFEECGLHVEAPEVVQPKETLKMAMERIVGETPVNETTGFATHLVKKRMEDGSWCKKCNDVAAKLEQDGTAEWVGNVSIADITDADSDGIKLAKHFQEEKAPFFVVREAGSKEWHVIYSYGMWKSKLKKNVQAQLPVTP